ncbi:MAG: thiamine-phosphate kinase [Acidobacteria bacterium]|nr:thiamine-phosphate kinase [Acidobacteriota bacterium]
MTVGERGEHALIEWLRRHLPAPGPDVLVGIGDDAAVLRPPRGEFLVQTTDALVDGVHLSTRFMSPDQIGRRAVAVNLSDVAAMAARPSWLLLSLVLPDSFPVTSFEGLVAGAAEASRAAGASIVGGNITRTTGPLVVDVTLTGHVRPKRLLRRSTARAGDELWLTGTIGGGAAGLAMLTAGELSDAACIARYISPTPRLREAWAMARDGAARAAIDLSDGFADAVRQLAGASSTGARIEAAALPLEPGARRWSESRGLDPVAAAIGGSDDYELLFAVSPKAGGRLRAARGSFGTALTKVGHLTATPALLLRTDGIDTPLPTGFEHFASA